MSNTGHPQQSIRRFRRDLPLASPDITCLGMTQELSEYRQSGREYVGSTIPRPDGCLIDRVTDVCNHSEPCPNQGLSTGRCYCVCLQHLKPYFLGNKLWLMSWVRQTELLIRTPCVICIFFSKFTGAIIGYSPGTNSMLWQLAWLRVGTSRLGGQRNLSRFINWCVHHRRQL